MKSDNDIIAFLVVCLIIVGITLTFGFVRSEPSVSLVKRSYPGTEWKTVYGNLEEIDKYCRGALGNPGAGAKWTACILPERKTIACSDLKSCLHEAVHAVDPEWDKTPQHRRLFRPEDE